MFDVLSSQGSTWFRAKYLTFAFIAAMTVYVLYHNERFVLDPSHPVWQHYEPFKWWLLPHGLAGACALLLAPMQFSDRLRGRFTNLHRVIGRIYVASVLVLAPLGVYIQYVQEPPGSRMSFTTAAVVDAVLLMIVTGIGLIFALKRMIPQHRQWMTRSYAVALVFFEVRFILGVTGWDTPPDIAIAETVVWSCLVFSVLIGDLANQVYEWPERRVRAQVTQAGAIGAAHQQAV